MQKEKYRCRLAVTQALLQGNEVTLAPDQAHYVRHVLRAAVGEQVQLFNGRDGEWCAEITELSKKNVLLKLMSQTRLQTCTPNVTLLLSAIKSARMEQAVEQATEIGVRRIVPVRTARAQPAQVNIERLSTIAREAAEQCERLEWPEILPYTKLTDALAQVSADATIFYGDESGNSPIITQHMNSKKSEAWALLVGPEGGFSLEEFALLERLPNTKGIGLGPRILRTGTASLTMLAITMAAFGDWHD